MPVPRQTHTYAALEVSPETYDEIAGKLREAGYDHAFIKEDEEHPHIDMHGIGLVRAEHCTPVHLTKKEP